MGVMLLLLKNFDRTSVPAVAICSATNLAEQYRSRGHVFATRILRFLPPILFMLIALTIKLVGCLREVWDRQVNLSLEWCRLDMNITNRGNPRD